MKIDITKIKKGTSEVPPECQAIIQKLKACYQDNNNENLLQELQQTSSWTSGKCELFHWVDVLNIFDDILEHGARHVTPGLWSLAADTYNKKSRDLLLEVLRFTTLLIENSFSRHLYNSMEHLLALMGSSNLEILNGVLSLLYMFSKRSNFIPRLHQDSKSALLKYLMYLAESWGGWENGFGLASCCQEVLKPDLRESATTLHFEYYDDTPNHKNKVTTIHIENIDKIDKSLSSLMDELIETYDVIESQRMVLFTQLRLAHGFSDYRRRLLCVQARLQAISVLVYSNGLQDNTHQAVIYNGLLEELVELLELSAPELVDIRAAALLTLTSVIHLDRNPHFPKKPGSRLLTIIDVTGASNYHGQLPSMVRTCIASLTGSQPHEQARAYGASLQSFPLPLATALFSFLYHLASYEAGGEALVSCGMMESLLKVINWPGEDLDQITFVTRAVRVIDLIANIDMSAFQAHQGLASFINRLELEVNICRKEQPFEIKIPGTNETVPEDIETSAPPVSSLENNGNVWRSAEESSLTNPRVMESVENPMMEEGVGSTENREEVRWNQSDFSTPVSSQKSSRSTNIPDQLQQASTSTAQDAQLDVPMQEGQDNNETWVPKIIKIFSNPDQNTESAMEVDDEIIESANVEATNNDTIVNEPQPGTSTSVSQYSSDLFERTSKVKESVDYSGNRWQDAKTGKTCLPQRAGLIKSILNFLKKAIQDQALSESMRTVMEGSLPSSLKHVISNSDYYGPNLFLLATDVVTVYIFQEPSLLSTLQDNYLTDVVLQAMLVKEVPATREVLASLPNVISALCLNSRGLAQFKQFHSFDHLCEIFVHPLYLPAMRRRRSNDPLGDTATTLGNAMDELMRHHPDLKTEAMKAVINLLDEIYIYGTSPQYTCESYTSKKTSTSPDPPVSNNTDGGGSSDEEEDEDKEAPTASYYVRVGALQGKPHTPIPLIDYIHNVMKFVGAILSNNSTEDHCKEFVALGGLKYVVKLLSMPNLPADYAVTPAAQAVANVCKSILSLAREPKVLEEGLKELQQVLTNLEPLTDHSSGKCVLLHELAMVPDLDNALYSYSATPLLHSMAATHGFVIMLVHVCRTGQSEMRNTSIFTWGSALGLDVLHKLSKLYTSLVWESTLLLALCSDDVIPSDCDFGQQDLNLLLPQKEGRLIRTTTEAMNTMKVESPSSDVGGEGTFASSSKTKATRIAPTPEQLKHLKLLLGAASRLGRALAELFGLLVKLCVGSPKRRVTFQQQAFYYPAVGATDVAKAMSNLLARGLNWNLVPPAPLEKFKLTYLICSVGFTSPMLFDDKKQPYHMIMHYFVEGDGDGSTSGLMAFFDSMYHALAGDGCSEGDKESGKKEFPEGTGEFLDAWLMLLEKMTNPKMILDSPNVFVQEHKVENTPILEFCPYRYLVKIHRMAFGAIMEMWCRKPLKGYGFRMTDSMLRILKHILVGEKILQERLEEASAKQISLTTYGEYIRRSSGFTNRITGSPLDGSFPFQGFSSSTPNSHVQVNETLISQLCDMGFLRDAAIEALSQSRSIEMAIGYLVENNRSSYQDALDDLRDIEQNLSEVFGTSSRETSNSNAPRDATPTTSHSSAGQSQPGHSDAGKPKKKWRCEMPLAEREAEMMNDIKKYQLSQETMSKFTENALAQCLEVLENLPETVYRVSDLLMVISDRNGFPWCENMLEALCKDISVLAIGMLKEIKNGPVTIVKVHKVLIDCPASKKLAVRLHLLTLLFDDLRFACIRALSHTCLICFLIQLLEILSKYMGLNAPAGITKYIITPKWVAPLLLLLDLYEKTAVYTQRMHEMHKACTGVWKWFQLKTGKWTLYTSQNNKLINLAYWSGAPGCRVTVGETRRKYHINFNTLLQVNEDTNRGLPITMILRQPDQDGLAAEMTGNEYDKEKSKEYESIYNQSHNRSQHPIPSISESDRYVIIQSCVKLIQIPVEPDALHALMRLTLRLTRDYSLAKFFAEKGGVAALLELDQDSNFNGFSSLATLIFRHVMEDPATLRNAIERTIRSRISNEIQPFFRELLFMMRHSEAGICRNPELYLEVAQKVLQIEYCDSFEGRYILKYVRKTERASNEETSIDKTAVGLIRTLLDQLVVPDEYLLKSYSEGDVTGNNAAVKEAAPVEAQNKFVVSELDTFSTVLGSKKLVENPEKEKKEGFTEGEKEPKKLLSKSVILSVLTDAVKSYAGFSKLIMDHVYEADPENPVLTEDMTAIRFILEKFVLLPGVDKESLEISAEARLLLGAVGACNHSAAIQSALVMEVKNCIQRIVSAHYEDTKKKYTDVSCILSLISEMMAMCPPVNWLSIVNNSFIKMKNNVAHLSNISKLFTRKGLINELARLPHNLDLSNPNFVLAMNAALKPLETLTKLANDRGNRSHAVDTTFKSGPRQNASARPAQEAEPTLTNSSGTTSGNTNAQGEEANEDAENTENDLSAAAESLEPVSDSQVNDDITDIGEIVLEDQNMDRDADRSNSMHMDEIVIPQDREAVENDDLSNPMTLQTALMQMTSEMVHGLITELQPSNQEQLTDPDDPDNLEEDQYGDEQMEEDNNEVDEGGYNNENDDPDDDFLMDTTIFNRAEHLMNDLFFVHYPSNENETLGSLNELYSDDSSLRPEEPVLQNPPPIYHPLLVRRNREESVPLRNLRSRPRRYRFLQLNPRSTSTNRPDILQNLLFSRRRYRTADYRQGGDQDTHNSGNHFRNSNLVLMENGFGMLTRPDEDNIDLLDQSMEYFGQHLTTNAQSVCYVRWASEMKILDADSAAMAATVLSHRLRATLETNREDLKAKHTNSPAMDVSSPPNTAETKNVEMRDVSQHNADPNAALITQVHNQQTGDEITDIARTESTLPIHESTRLAEGSAATSNRPPAESNVIEPRQITEATGESNLRDAFTSYFMFDDDERAEPAFPVYGANSEMTDEDTTRNNFDLGSAAQEAESELPFLEWESHAPSDEGLPLRRIPGSVSIAPTLVPPAVYPLLSSSTPLPAVDQSLEVPSNLPSQNEDQQHQPPSQPPMHSVPISNTTENIVAPPSGENVNPSSQTITEPENNEPTNRSASLFPDFLPSIFGQNPENSERPATSQPIQSFGENENTAPMVEDETGSRNTAPSGENTGNENSEEASPVPLDPEEMIQLYPNGRATYRGISIPAGLDPSFLAALPSEMREEVFSNHLRQQSLQRSDLVRDSTTPPSANTDEVNPEFLAALPLNIQEEVLAQQRQERQRQVAAATNHNDPFDAAAFFQNLPSSLRQSILADIEESQISVLPPDLAAEAQNLRREHDARNRQYFQERERILSHNTLSSILRGAGPRGTRVAIHGVPSIRSQWGISSISRGSDGAAIEPSFETIGRQLLDQEAVSTLLLLLFVQDFRLNISRLHRVIRNLCCHPPTRDFVSRTLISIMEKCNESRCNTSAVISRQLSPKRKISRSSSQLGQPLKGSETEPGSQASDPEPIWLNLSMDAALGCRANVFQVQLKRYGKRSLDNYLAHSVTIHPQAAPIVFRNAMDLLYTLTKVFQNEFLPKKPKNSERVEDASVPKKAINTAFWDILVRLENLNSGKSSKKGKSALKNQTSTPFSEVEPRSSSFDKSLMGHLVTMLTYPLVKASTQLTDKLLHILNLVSEGFTELDEEEAIPVTEEHLKIIVNVLTSNGCSENGLEQATSLLIRMSNCPDPTRLTSLKLLISGAQDVAALVKQHIQALLFELREANAKAKSELDLEVELKESHRKGQIQDRFTKKSVVITAPSKVKGGFDIQLPAMQPLISKTSSQSFFLRILKVIIQLREVLVIRRKLETDQRKESKEKKRNADGGNQRAQSTLIDQGESSRRRLAAMTTVMETEDNALVSLYQANDGNDDGARSAASSMSVDLDLEFENNGQNSEENGDREDTTEDTVIENTIQSNDGENSGKERAGEPDGTMETDAEKESQEGKAGDDKENLSYQIPSLTKQLQLDDLWIILSECLTELEKTPDHHAALILQPAVEAFFLVHSTAINECRALANAATSSAPVLPRRNRAEGPLPLMPIFPGFDFGVTNLLDRSQPPSNVLVSVTASNVPSTSIQALSQGNSQQQSRTSNNSFGHIITEYRKFVQSLGVASSGPLSVDVDSENVAESSSGTHSQHCNDLNSTSLATFFKHTEASPLMDPLKFLRFAELHRAVLNQILRQSTIHLPDGPFAILVNFTRVLDFDVKRKYFRQELEKMHDGSRRGDETAVNVNRSHVFEESFRELHRKSPDEWKNKFYVVFENEEGQDAGGLLREWYMIISREIFNPDYALFTVSPGDRVTYTINPSSHCNPNHLLYFKFVGRLIAKAIYDSKYLECYFTRSFYKHILGIPVKYQDMESEDPEFYEGLVYLKKHKVSELGNDLTFTTDVQEFGVTESRELKPNGANIPVTDENKMDYIHLVCQMKMTGAIRKQLDAFLEGFYEIIPKHLISIFNEQELELLISGLPNIDIDDLKNNTEYNKYSRNSIQIVWFWRALREMDGQDQAKFLQFVTGTSKVPLQGFAALEGMNGIQKFQIHRDDRSTDRLPSAHTCFNQLDLPAYETYTKLKNNLLKAIHECSEGFGFV